MRIQLNQEEITAAIRQHIASQGMVLKGKTLTIGYTASRGPMGITADITIEDDTALPDLADTPVEDEAAKPALVVVPKQMLSDVAEAAAQPQEAVAEAAPAPRASSLFS